MVKLPGHPELQWHGSHLLEVREGVREIRVILKGTDERVNDPVLILPPGPETLRALESVRGRSRVKLPGPALILGLLVGIAMVVVALMLAVSNLWRIIPPGVDVALGDGFHEMVQEEIGPVTTSRPAAQEFLDDCLARLVEPGSDFTPQVVILQSEMVNAFALPGGRIYFCSGLIDQAESPEELAGILGHELAHVEQRHTMKNLSKAVGVVFIASTLVGVVGGLEEFEAAELILEGTSLIAVMHYSRKMEAEADDWALKKLEREGISAVGIRDFFQRLFKSSQGTILEKIPNWASTHPSTRKRLRKMESHVAGESGVTPLLSEERWKAIQEED